MSSRELPNPPGGTVTCADTQFCEIEIEDDGSVHAACHNIDPPDDGGGPGGQYMGGGMGAGRVYQGVVISPNVKVEDTN
ncbi:MAG: hypothetical protein OQK04_20295, partial [Kangiellaceae bacterium]|nr:hypothetical protein [Kangiellaceae bacterium]